MTPMPAPTSAPTPAPTSAEVARAAVDPELLAALSARGTLQRAEGDRPFLVDGDAAWLVRAGQVDVFSVALADGAAPGARTHLFRVDAGQVLIGAGRSPAGLALLAVGTGGTVLLRCEQAVLRALASDPVHTPAVVALLEGWVEALCGGVVHDIAPKRCADLEAGQEVAVAERTSVRPRRRVCWVRHLEGHSLLLGREELTVNGTGYTPLSHRAWLEARHPSRLVLVETAALPTPDAMWDGLATLHALALRYTELLARQRAGADRDRLRRKLAAGRAALAGACSRLVATMDPGTARHPRLRLREPAADESNDEALLAACRLVGEALGITLRPYPRAEGGAAASRDALSAILSRSRIRTRKVALRDDWWRHENGPLLAYRAEGERPVALLRRGARDYVLHDPVERTAVPVTAEVAATLAPFAYALYRPLPSAALTPRDVLGFGLVGSRRDVGVMVLMGLAGALLGMVPAVATGVLFNSAIPGAQRVQLLHLTVVLVVCAVGVAMFTVVRGRAQLRIEGRMGSAVQAAVWDRLLSLPLPFFRPYTAGDLATRAMAIDGMRQIVSGSTLAAIMGGIFSLGNLGLMFYYSSTLAWRATLLIAVAVAVAVLGSWLQLRPQRGVARLQARTQGLVLQLLTGIAKLRVAGVEMQAFAQWAQRFGAQRELQYAVRRIANWVAAFNAAFPVAATLVLFWTALPLLSDGQTLRTGDFLAFLSAFTTCSAALLGTCTALLATLAAVPLYEQAKPILATLPEVTQAMADPGPLSGDVEVQHAVFRYQTDAPLVLRDLTFRVAPGEFVALVGPSGSGKSTILRLLLAFETLESGSIYYDGQELSALDVQAVRRQIGVVLQSGRLMSGDIFTNIAGSAPITIEEAWEAARMAAFADDIRAMPMGMHTVIGEGGGTLSGGQRQRLLIARAIVHRPRMLFFDEATSALDNSTQATVSRSLELLQATRIVVAHRLSTIVNADRILVLERGRLVQSGTYDDLIGQPGPFAELARRQVT